jgi:hypothetical protein
VFEGCLVALVVWGASSAGPPECEVASSLAYTKNRLKPNPILWTTTQSYDPANERDQHVLQSRKPVGWTLIYAHDAQTRRRTP